MSYGLIFYIVGLVMGFVLGFVDAYRYHSIHWKNNIETSPQSDVNQGEIF